MSHASHLHTLFALASLVPAILAAARRYPVRDAVFWVALAIGIAGSTVWAAVQIPDAWNASFSATLWVGIAASMIVYGLVALLDSQAWRLALLLVPYLFLWGLFAWAFMSVPAAGPVETPTPWLDIHIGVAVLTLGLLTVAAMGALASYIQVRALKTKRPGGFSRRLPAASDSDGLSAKLLIFAEIVLAIGVVTGMILERFATGSLLVLDHKTMMTLAAFVIIALLLIGRWILGVPGQVAARIVLLAYLLVVFGIFRSQIRPSNAHRLSDARQLLKN